MGYRFTLCTLATYNLNRDFAAATDPHYRDRGARSRETLRSLPC